MRVALDELVFLSGTKSNSISQKPAESAAKTDLRHAGRARDMLMLLMSCTPTTVLLPDPEDSLSVSTL